MIEEFEDIPIIREEDYPDNYAFQTARQNAGLPCSKCWALQGHFEKCSLLNSWEWDQATVDVLDRTARLAGESNVEWIPEFSEQDLVRLKGLGVSNG